jgi:hypothetical protein
MGAKADEAPCKKNRDCEVVRVLTRCDVEKQKLRNMIAVLERELKNSKDTNYQLSERLKTSYVRIERLEKETQQVVYQDRVIERKYVRTEVRHNLLSLYTSRDITGASTSYNGTTATAEVDTGYIPGIMYQYQFNMGITPGIGVNTSGHPSFYLGYGF